MDGRGKNGEKCPFFCCPPSPLTVQPVPGARGLSASTAALRTPSRRMVHVLQVCKPAVLEFHDEEASPSFPGSGSPLFCYFSCSSAPSDVCRLLLPSSVTACFAFLCCIPFCPMFSPWCLRFPSQEFLPSSDLSICSKHYPDALILRPLKTWLFWSCVFWNPSNPKHRYDCESVNLIVKQ